MSEAPLKLILSEGPYSGIPFESRKEYSCAILIWGTGIDWTAIEMDADTGARDGFDTKTVRTYGNSEGNKVLGKMRRDDVDGKVNVAPLESVQACDRTFDIDVVQDQAKFSVELSDGNASGS